MTVSQTLYAISDPNWGNAIVIPETVRAGQMGAMDAVLWMSEHSLYHGGSMIADKKGCWEKLYSHGFRLVILKDIQFEPV